MLDNLFSPGKIGNVRIKNRLVRSATFIRRAEKYGEIGQRYIDFYKGLADGGVGLIITGFTAVDPGGSGSPNQARLDDDSYISGHKKFTEIIHEISEVKIAPQIAHSGRPGYHPKYHPVAPSAIFYKGTGLTPRALTTEEVEDMVQKFIQAGRRAYESGYDMVQLHGAHGYLLSNFISPYTNKRTGKYGGTTENRVRILIDIYNGIRDEVGKQFPILIKLQTQDFIEDGMTLEEGVKVAEILAKVGFDAIEPSGGGADAFEIAKIPYPSLTGLKREKQNYFLPIVSKIKPLAEDSKLILMGGIKNPVSVDKILENKEADFIAMGRPFIREPNLPNRWKSGDLTSAKCVSCNSCYVTMMSGEVYCVVEKKLEKKRLRKQKKEV